MKVSTLFKMAVEGAKSPPTIFPPVTFTNIEIIPQNFSSFSFNNFATLL